MKNFSVEIKNIPQNNLTDICEEIRKDICEAVLKCGGHLSSNLGIVELTVALHYVFNFPKDKLIFDVGHQCYAHKILSGRSDKLNLLRKKNGISGFPKREESIYDCYNTGHAGTSISAALGIAKARDLNRDDFNVISIIGDGSFNNGLIYEALNSLKLINSNILIILNDNGMSISPTVGSMHNYLEFLGNKINTENEEFFSGFGLEYDGVYDGNDVNLMISKLKEVKEKLKTRSVILHVNTKKGKGYSFCEDHPEATHGVSISEEKAISTEYSQILGKKLIELCKKDNKVVAVTAAMTGSLGLNDFFEKFPNNAIDVGICEEHATVLCAAMATEGLKPYYAVYSTFLQRSFDEIIIDICSQNLPVTICVDRAGISGADGETHQGVFDLSYLSLIPNLTIAVPKDINEFSAILDFSLTYNKPLAIRYPREGKSIEITKGNINNTAWEVLEHGNCDYAMLVCGERSHTISRIVLNKCIKIGKIPTIINARFVKPLDKSLLNKIAEQNIITIEDNALIGGFGSQISSYYCNSNKKVKNFAYEDKFIYQGEVEELMDDFGVSAHKIFEYIITNED
ncbi:MAG: 1-deoxy-D-xylulose-5-phosphate synthase [Clostridiales bacterium]|nr:1-deoxy-D-xylulose-5-phosphate synthase [Clostridiales bacterium]